ncbi:LpqB family beta-propeller domain-containing protein [Phycicoccus sp. SLBN-51]|uniref:LpqB family beta-propeller domain-containing protein n=1 Tax=Phycicoccus sp. SLBN-51 TaxID=2768447 RepID=UPI00114E2F28|nr:LpqB family beta-propeller domain-containing protein [Phycicoccus sp. SLBN-51]TQJ51682.1 sporulation and spore germination protein [Phycicoccus sp. SLBN-51]
MRNRPLVVVVAAVLLAGCGGISSDSPVRPGLEVGAAAADPVKILFPGPASGSSPQQIVQGFLRAGAASDEEYEVARSFLSLSSGTTWRPDSSIMVFTDDSAVSVKAVRENTVKAVAKVSASIDANGRYRDLPAGTTVEATFGLQKVAGEWRISSVPDGFGLWLSASDVDRLYQPFRIHYVSTFDRSLVPDVRWFSVGKGLATRLARAQLGSPPAYLRGAVRSDVPVGTRLTVDAVPVDSGVATVDLTATKPGGDPVRRQNLWAQFVATLSQVPQVDRVALKVEGSDLDLPGVEKAPASLADLGFPQTPAAPAAQPLLRTANGDVFTVDPARIGEDRDAGPARRRATPSSIAPGWVWLAASKDGKETAAVGGDRAELSRWREGRQIRVGRFATQLTRPSYDRQDFLWVGGQSDGSSALWVVNTRIDPEDTARARPTQVAAPWLRGRSILAVRLSPDGQRAAVVSADAAGAKPRIDVAGVVRSANGTPESLAEPVALAPSLTLVRDLVWIDETRVALLGRMASTSPVRVWISQVGGRTTAAEASDVPAAQSITTVNGERGLVITTDGGRVLLRAGSSWLDVAKGTDFAVPAT